MITAAPISKHETDVQSYDYIIITEQEGLHTYKLSNSGSSN